MKICRGKSIVQGVFLMLICILGLSSASWGAEFWLRAETLTKTMPDTSVVTMWGFAQCTDGTYASCTPATVPGPRLTVPVGDTTLTINLRNNLTGPFVEPVSLVIPGQTIVPAPVRNPDGRVRSFTTETPPDNATTVTYTWTSMKTGTYLYQSGSHPAVQVQMGLYGAVTRNAAAGQAYGPSTAYAAEAILLFSEIDPVLHGHVAAGTYGQLPPTGITSTMNYEPKYFLINGEPFTPAAPRISAGIVGQNLLLRFLSAGLKHRVPTIYGLNISLVAEDGNPYPYPKEQYSLLLSPGKTLDALVTATPQGEFPVYDRRLGLTNNAAPYGGMLTYLSNLPLTITTTSLPGGVVGTAYPATTLTATGGSGPKTWSVSAGALPGGLTLSAAGVITGTPTAPGTFNFTVQVTDSSGTATKPLSIIVTVGPLTITTTSLPGGVVGTAYPATTLTATGGFGPKTWSIVLGGGGIGVPIT
ncbi:MAG: putative Ig domain-containing protein [Nitrospirae bacterium]|nr:putative Ig domain-containing protein [Nitrospirota bacterium]